MPEDKARKEPQPKKGHCLVCCLEQKPIASLFVREKVEAEDNCEST